MPDEDVQDEQTPDETPEAPPQQSEAERLGDAGKQAIDRMKAERNAANSRAKALERELAQLRQASMSEAERAVAEAEARGESRAQQMAVERYGKALARERFNALAVQRNPEFDVTRALKRIDLKSFIKDDGDLDDKEIAAAVADLVPEIVGGPPSFDGGVRRTASKTPDMNALIRNHLGSRLRQ